MQSRFTAKTRVLSGNDLEADLENKVVKWAWTTYGILGSKLKILGETGYPDRVFWIPGGKPLLIEFKRPGEEPKVDQQRVHKMLLPLGYNLEVHKDYGTAIEAITRAVETALVSENQCEILVAARRSGFVPRPWLGKDKHSTGSPKTAIQRGRRK